MSKPLGFVSQSGMIAAAVFLALVGLWTVFSGQSMFSSGGLSTKASGRTLGGVTSHAQTGGSCAACHSEPWSSQDMAYRCVKCHTNVSSEIQTRKGLHGFLVGKSASLACRDCHAEHLGPNGVLTAVDDKAFPHDLTGYSLVSHRVTVKGPAFTCKDCHGNDLMQFDEAACGRCHTSIDARFMTQHQASFGPKCLLCHDGSGRDGANFDHNKFAFKLTGAHAGATCVGCHTPARTAQPLNLTPTDCYSCHGKDDRHGGQFGRQCGQCHSTSSWGGSSSGHGGFAINHHGAGNCATCHPNGTSTYTCYGCHAHSPASIQARHDGRSASSLANCVQCHGGGGRGGGGERHGRGGFGD